MLSLAPKVGTEPTCEGFVKGWWPPRKTNHWNNQLLLNKQFTNRYLLQQGLLFRGVQNEAARLCPFHSCPIHSVDSNADPNLTSILQGAQQLSDFHHLDWIETQNAGVMW